MEDVTGAEAVDPDLITVFDERGGYLRPAEGNARIPEIVPMLEHDLTLVGSAV